MIRNCGILKMGFEDGDAESSSALALVEEVYRIYTSKEPEYAPDQPAVKCFMERMSHNLQRPPVEFMGLLDTVGDLGVPKLNSGPGVSTGSPLQMYLPVCAMPWTVQQAAWQVAYRHVYPPPYS